MSFDQQIKELGEQNLSSDAILAAFTGTQDGSHFLAGDGTLKTISGSAPSGTGFTHVTAGVWDTPAALLAADMPSGIDAAKIGGGAVSNTEFGYLDGVTSAIQTQINALSGFPDAGTTGGTSTAYTATLAAGSTLASGFAFLVVFNATNGAAPTIALSGGTARPLRASGAAPPTASIIANVPYLLRSDGTNVHIVGRVTGIDLPLTGGDLSGGLGANSGVAISSTAANIGSSSTAYIHNNLSSNAYIHGSSLVGIQAAGQTIINLSGAIGITLVQDATTGLSASVYQAAIRHGSAIKRNVPTGCDFVDYVNATEVMRYNASKMTSAVPVELSTNGLGTSSAVYLGKDANGMTLNAGTGGIQFFGSGALNGQFNPSFGLLFYTDHTDTVTTFHQIARTSKGLYLTNPSGQATRLRSTPTSVGTTFATIASVSGITQGEIKVTVTGKGTATLEWDGTTLVKKDGVASIVVAGSAASGETALRVSGTRLQAIVDAGTRNVSVPQIVMH